MPTILRILLALNDFIFRRQVESYLEESGCRFQVRIAGADLYAAARSHEHDLILVDDELRPDWAESVAQLHREDPAVAVVMITRRSSERLAIQALRSGVREYVNWPEDRQALIQVIRNCLAERAVAPTEAQQEGDSLVGSSRAIRELRSFILQVGPADCSVLVTGETGTGKELAAEMIHERSPRRDRPFVCINCAAIPDALLESELFGYERGAFTGAHCSTQGKLEMANGGTIVLDEIGEMSAYAQAKILRAIDRKEVFRLGGHRRIALDVRVLAATNRDLESMTRANLFRQDLYFRLNVVRVHLPPLRERKEDIPALVRHFLPELNSRYHRRIEGLSAQSLERLSGYHWPGNIRELKNAIEAAFVTARSRRITWTEMPEAFRRLCESAPERPDERELVLSALRESNWNKTQAAGRLRWSRMTLYRKIAKYQVPDDPLSS